MSLPSLSLQDIDRKSRKPSHIVDAAIEKFLERPDIGPGSKLPTERALAAELNVARSAVRVALARLELQGRVVRIIGSGTYVADPDPMAKPEINTAAGDSSPIEIMEARLLIEPCLAGPVVARGNSADLAAIRHAMNHAVEAVDFEMFEYWDGVFHHAIAEATHNQLLIDVYQTITTSREQADWGDMKRSSFTEERRQIYNREHGEIIAALQTRNTARAEAAVRAHLLTVRHDLLEL